MAEITFAGELRKIIEHSNELFDTTFFGDICYGKLVGDRHVVRLRFEDDKVRNEYNSIEITVIHKLHGKVDSQVIRFKDACNWKGRSDYMFISRANGGQFWYYSDGFTDEDYELLTKAVDSYLSLFV